MLGLDTSRRFRVSGKLGAAQLEWLADTLADGRATLIFMHHPPVAVGTWWLDKDLLRDREQFSALINRNNVLGVACGHVHQPFEGSLGRIPVWTTPSTAYQFLPASWIPRTQRAAAGFRVLEFAEGRVRTAVHDAG